MITMFRTKMVAWQAEINKKWSHLRELIIKLMIDYNDYSLMAKVIVSFIMHQLMYTLQTRNHTQID